MEAISITNAPLNPGDQVQITRYPVVAPVKRTARLAIVLAFALAACARPLTADETKKVYGSAFLDSFFDPGQEVPDAIKLRYKCKVVENKCASPEMWKIIFMFHFLHGPGNPKLYELQSNLYTWRFVYPHLSRRKANGEVPGLQNLAGESSLFLSVPDNNKDKKIGARSQSPKMLPTLDQEIDGIKDLWKREQVSQLNLTGKTLAVEIARGKIAKDLRDWSVHGELPAGTYRNWTITATWDDVPHKVDFVLPEESARYFVAPRMTQIASEAFVINPGLFKVFFWDIEIQRENRTDWKPIRKWKLVESDARENTWGMKRSKFAGRPAIEVSNDGTRTYAKKGEIIELR